jgi:hypothetical protein
MGASVIVYWPGMTEAQVDAQPGFRNDDKAWGDWMAEREGDQATLTAICALCAEAILTYKTAGMVDEEVAWVRPAQLRAATTILGHAIRTGRPETGAILASYARRANHSDAVADDFIRDLDDIAATTRWAEAEGAARMTLEVNW